MANRINYKALQILCEEFNKYLKNIQGLFVDSILGFHLIDKSIKQDADFLKNIFHDPDLATSEFLESTSFSHESLIEKNVPSAGLFFHKKGEVRRRVENGGHNEHYLGLVVIVSLYAYWEGSLRNKITKAYGMMASYENDFWGDMRLLRNALVHKGGKTKSEMRKGARLKVFKDISQREEILLSRQDVRDILCLACGFRNFLHSESFPKNSIAIPKSCDQN